MSKHILALSMLLLAGVSVQAQHTEKSTNEWNDKEIFEQHKIYPRANVVAYSDEDGIEKWEYKESAYYVSLNGSWKCDIQKDYHDRSSEFEKRGFAPTDWDDAEVPCRGWKTGKGDAAKPAITTTNSIPSTGNSTASFYRTFDVPKDWKQYQAFLQLQGSSAYYIWVNQEYAGYSEDSRAISEFDITPHLKYGSTNSIIIQVVSLSDGSLLETGYDRHLNGITGDVAICLKNAVNIQDYAINAPYDAASRTGTLNLDINVANRYRKGRYYVEVSLWNPQGKEQEKMGKWVFFDKKSEVRLGIGQDLGTVEPWSAEHPSLYTAVVRLLDEEMHPLEVVGTRFGFRTIAVEAGQLVLNGSAIKLKGCTYTDTGASRDVMRATLIDMKRHNINAVRTTLYSPADPCFYELCDELGLYVVCDANIHPFSSHSKAIATDGDYSDLFVTRVQNMYESYKNHTSIIAWSLGDADDNGTCIANAYKEMKRRDKSRPTLFGGAGYADNSDLIAIKNGNYEQLRQYRSKAQPRPLLLFSYGSATGNSFGNIEPLWQTVRDNKGIVGGFAPSWVAYRHSDGSDDQTQPSFAAMPYADELRNIYRPFDITLSHISPDDAEFVITNLNDFLTLKDYRVEYKLYSNLKSRIIEGEVSMSLLPHESKSFKLKIPKLTMYAGEELFIRFDTKTRNATAAYDKGLILATTAFPIPMEKVGKQPIPDYDRRAISVVPVFADDSATVAALAISGTHFTMRYDLAGNAISEYTYNDTPLITGAIRFNAYRQPTDNDRIDHNALPQWLRLNPATMQSEVVSADYRMSDSTTLFINALTRYKAANGATLFDVRQNYTVLHTGDVLIDNEVLVDESVKTLPRIGMTMDVADAIDTVAWFGADRESYSDRQCGVIINQHMQPAAAMAYDYGGQQASGNRIDTRWGALYSHNTGLYFDMLDSLFQFSLMPDGEGWQLCTDLRHCGVGSATSDIAIAPCDLVRQHHALFCVHLRGFDRYDNDARDFSRTAYPHTETSVAEAPVISSDKDHFDSPLTITLALPKKAATTTARHTIRYTLDGSTPTIKSTAYTAPFVIENSTMVKARTFIDGQSPSFVSSRQFNYDYIAEAIYAQRPNTPYNHNYQTLLSDGEEGDIENLTQGWVGFSGNNLDVTFRLSKAIDLDGVRIHFAHQPEAWIFAPKAVTVYVSTDGEHYGEAMPATLDYDPAGEEYNAAQKMTVTVKVEQPGVRFVRIEAANLGRIPQWHKAKGLHAWLLADEVELISKITSAGDK